MSNWSRSTVERITPDGQRSVYVELPSPSGLALDVQGNVYVASYSGNVVYRVTRAGDRQEFVAGFNTPAGISFDAAGNLLVCNRASDEIMRVTPEGAVHQVAGGLSTPVGVVEDSDGTIYVSNYVGGVLSRIDRDGKVEAFSDDFAGLGSEWRSAAKTACSSRTWRGPDHAGRAGRLRRAGDVRTLVPAGARRRP